MSNYSDGRSDLFGRGAGSFISRRVFGVGAAGALFFGTTAARADASTPKKGGVLRLAMRSLSASDTFNSARFLSNDFFRALTFYNTLVVMGPDLRPEASLAEAFEANANFTRWIFTLKKGVVFHDGSPLKPADVVFSIMRHKEKKVASSAKPLLADVESVMADGDSRVVVQLSSPNVDFPSVLSAFQFTIVKDGTYDFTRPNGTGPFKVKEFRPGISTIGIRNENYWKPGQPYLDRIEVFAIGHPAARVNALLSGDADLVEQVPFSVIGELSKSRNAKPFVTKASLFAEIISLADRAPSNNKDLRYAFAYLMDRKRFLTTVLKGYGVLANDTPIAPGSGLFNHDLPQRELDLDKAKFHFSKSGVGQTALPVHYCDLAPHSQEMVEILQRGASQIGLNLQPKREPTDGYWSTVWRNKPFVAGWWQPRPNYNMMLTLDFTTQSPWNETRGGTPHLDALIAAARSVYDAGKRKEIYNEIQKILYDQANNLIPAFFDYVDGMSSRVRGLVPIPVGPLGGYNFAEKVWLET